MRALRRTAWTHPDIAGFLTGAGLGALDIPSGLAPRALRDIEAEQGSGRFTVPDAKTALSAVAAVARRFVSAGRSYSGREPESVGFPVPA